MSGRKGGASAVVPWRDWAEWQHVHEALFSEDPYAQQRGISRVAAWRSRAQLPVAINATAQLAELQLHEQLAEHHHHAVGVSSRSHMELSLLYASVIVRCVNGLVDGSQTGSYAMAVSALAQRIGIPLWIVDLRHESTHNQLPSLPVLRFAAQHLLAWLRANYWHKQEEEIRRQVHQAASWLFARPPLAPPTSGGDQPEPIQAVPFDADSVRNVFVPLLAFGEQYGERVAPTGLLFLPRFGNDGEQRDENGVAIEDFTDVLLELQGQWQRFSAWLMACLAKKVFRALPVSSEAEEAEEGESKAGDSQAADGREVRQALQWVNFLTSKAWREQLKPAAVDDIYSCGAEMLLVADRLRNTQRRGGIAKKPAGGSSLDQLISILRSVSDVHDHPMLVAESGVAESMDASASASGWRALPGWTACPLGLRYSYNADWLEGSGLVEYSLDDDSVPPPDGSAFVVADENDAVGEATDKMLKESDEEYDQALQQIADLHTTISKEHRANTFSAASIVIPKQELQRIQDEIEIW